jgi:hypothetical protein
MLKHFRVSLNIFTLLKKNKIIHKNVMFNKQILMNACTFTCKCKMFPNFVSGSMFENLNLFDVSTSTAMNP